MRPDFGLPTMPARACLNGLGARPLAWRAPPLTAPADASMFLQLPIAIRRFQRSARNTWIGGPMRAHLDSYVVDALFALHSSWRGASAVARRLRSLTASAFDTYRPELHYMRGPGPKWRAKNKSS